MPGIIRDITERELRKRREMTEMSMLMLEAVLLLALIAITLVVIFNKDLMVVVVTYCAFSFITMFLYIVMGAADVAFTEAVIGVISTIYFIMTLRNIDRRCK